jgi:hypothetical protein
VDFGPAAVGDEGETPVLTADSLQWSFTKPHHPAYGVFRLSRDSALLHRAMALPV